MKKLTILTLIASLASVSSAQSAEGTDLSAPSLRMERSSRLGTSLNRADTMALKASNAPADDGEKKAQIWLLGLSYERFSGENAGDEFGFTPTGILGYQRNFYPSGRIKNATGYSVGVGLFGAGAALFYHQGSARRVDFRVGIAVDVFYVGNIYGGSAVGVIPFAEWGIKI